MNCKDCIYFKRCVALGVELDMKRDKEADKNCRFFKNKDNVVEVLRCKDCKYFIDREGKCYGQDIRAEDRYIFRGKRKDNNEWVTGYYVFQRKRSGVFGQVISELDFDRHLIIDLRGNSHEVIPETVGQCTGLTDKNGKKIFEGDICKHRSNYSGNIVISVVTYTDGHFLALVCENSGFELSEKLEVIGNIHDDNPELLEVER